MEYNRLKEFIGNRRRFDPSSKEDLKELEHFNKNGRWKTTCPFLIEWPFKDILTLCNTRYTEHMLRTNKKAP